VRDYGRKRDGELRGGEEALSGIVAAEGEVGGCHGGGRWRRVVTGSSEMRRVGALSVVLKAAAKRESGCVCVEFGVCCCWCGVEYAGRRSDGVAQGVGDGG